MKLEESKRFLIGARVKSVVGLVLAGCRYTHLLVRRLNRYIPVKFVIIVSLCWLSEKYFDFLRVGTSLKSEIFLSRKIPYFLCFIFWLIGSVEASEKEVLSYEQLMEAHKAHDFKAVSKVLGYKITDLSEKQIELIACITARDMTCFDVLVQDMELSEFVNPAGAGLSPFEVAIVQFAPTFVERFLELGINPNALKVSSLTDTHSGSYLFDLTTAYWGHKYNGAEKLRFATEFREQDYSKDPNELRYPVEIEKDTDFLGSKYKQKYSLDDIKEILELLLEYGADVNLLKYVYDSDKSELECWSVLSNAAFRNVSELAELFIDHGSTLSDVECDGKYILPMYWAIRDNDVSTLKLLLPAPTEVVMEQGGMRPKPGIARQLYAQGYDINDFSLLISAISYNDVELFDQLLNEKNTNVNVAGKKSMGSYLSIPLKHAVKNADFYMVSQLLGAGADPCYEAKHDPNYKGFDAYGAAISGMRRAPDIYTPIKQILEQSNSDNTCIEERMTREND